MVTRLLRFSYPPLSSEGLVDMSMLSLRAQLCYSRLKLRTAYQEAAAKQMFEQFLSLFSSETMTATINHIAVYWPVKGEMQTDRIMQWAWQQQKKIYLPVVSQTRQNKILRFAQYQPETPVNPNRFCIPEPASADAFIAIEKLDVMLLPLVAFDISGHRLGMGGGFYDITLYHARRKPYLIGLSYDFQRVDSLPVKPTDVSLDAVVTEKQSYCWHNWHKVSHNQ